MDRSSYLVWIDYEHEFNPDFMSSTRLDTCIIYFGCSFSQQLSTRLVLIISFKCRHRIPLFNKICIHLSRSFWYFFFFSTICCHSCGGVVSTAAVADLSLKRTLFRGKPTNVIKRERFLPVSYNCNRPYH